MDPAYISIFVVGMVLVTTLPIFFVMRRVFGGMRRQQAETQRLLATGIPAPAQVLAVQMGGMTITTGVHRHLQLVLSLQVQAPGRPPYAAQMTTMVSELQIPQLQPGATVQVRIDPQDPGKVALEAIGHVPINPAAAAAPRMQYGAGPAAMTPGVTPVQPVRMPAGAKVGLIVGIVGAIIGVGVTIAVTVVNVGGVGPSSTPEPSSVCGRAVTCCQKISASSGTADNCKNLGNPVTPDSACQSALDGFRLAAEARGLTCE